jgi:hypothetical protein
MASEVDHLKSVPEYPELRLELSNLRAGIVTLAL